MLNFIHVTVKKIIALFHTQFIGYLAETGHELLIITFSSEESFKHNRKIHLNYEINQLTEDSTFKKQWISHGIQITQETVYLASLQEDL